MSELPDTGIRAQYDGGAVREDDPDKPSIEGVSPFAMFRLGLLFTAGGKKYGDFRNWEGGMPLTRFYAAILRHAFLWMAGDEAEDHMAAVMWNAQAIMHFEELRPDLDDRPKWSKSKPSTALYEEWLTRSGR